MASPLLSPLSRSTPERDSASFLTNLGPRASSPARPAPLLHPSLSPKVWKGMSRDYELEQRFDNLIKKV